MAKPRLIIVDDDPVFANFVAEIAKFSDFEVDAVTSVRQFRELYALHTHDIVTTDISMPDTDGYELIDELAAMGCTSEIILISGIEEALLHGAVTLARAKNLNVIAAMRKPFEVEEFEKILESCLTRLDK